MRNAASFQDCECTTVDFAELDRYGRSLLSLLASLLAIYQALGLPDTIAWKNGLDRPHRVNQAIPIRGLC